MNARYLVVIGIIAATTTVIFYGFGILYPSSFKLNSQWGDFVGGSLGPILTFFGFLGLLYTIKIQSDELSLTREELSRSASALEMQGTELKKQSFENTFFNMLEFHTSIVNNIHHRSSGNEYTGRECFVFYYNELKMFISSLRLTQSGCLPEEFANSYSKFWKRHGHALGHYYRYLYSLISFSDSNEQYGSLYINLIYAQLTDIELILLYYNAHSYLDDRKSSLLQKNKFFSDMRSDLLIVK